MDYGKHAYGKVTDLEELFEATDAGKFGVTTLSGALTTVHYEGGKALIVVTGNASTTVTLDDEVVGGGIATVFTVKKPSTVTVGGGGTVKMCAVGIKPELKAEE